jgi:hypothetical protein
VRLFACAAFLIASTLAVAGCGGDVPDVGQPTKQPDGTASVTEFAEYAQAVDEDWEHSPAMTAGEFLQLDQRTATKTTIEATASAEGRGPQTVVVTLDGLLDDSVRAERWTLSFEPDGDVYRLTESTWAQRCQPERGHQDYSPEPCL